MLLQTGQETSRGKECDTERTRKRRAPQETQEFDAGRERKSDVQIERGRKKKFNRRNAVE